MGNDRQRKQHAGTSSSEDDRTTSAANNQYHHHHGPTAAAGTAAEQPHPSNNNQPSQPSLPPPKMQMFEVRVPAGVEPGQPFALSANGQRVLVTCPPNVQVGQKIRFNLPVTQQMVQKIQLQYNNSSWFLFCNCKKTKCLKLYAITSFFLSYMYIYLMVFSSKATL